MFTGRHAPLYGLQWHPEKSLFVFNPVLAVDHSIYATIAAQYIANFFIAECRMNPNTFNNRGMTYIVYLRVKNIPNE